MLSRKKASQIINKLAIRFKLRTVKTKITFANLKKFKQIKKMNLIKVLNKRQIFNKILNKDKRRTVIKVLKISVFNNKII